MNYNRTQKLLYDNTQGVYLPLKNVSYLFKVPRGTSRIPVDQGWGFQLLTVSSILDGAEILDAPLGTVMQINKLHIFNFYDMKTNPKVLPFHLLKCLLQLIHDRIIHISLQLLILQNCASQTQRHSLVFHIFQVRDIIIIVTYDNIKYSLFRNILQEKLVPLRNQSIDALANQLTVF